MPLRARWADTVQHIWEREAFSSAPERQPCAVLSFHAGATGGCSGLYRVPCATERGGGNRCRTRWPGKHHGRGKRQFNKADARSHRSGIQGQGKDGPTHRLVGKSKAAPLLELGRVSKSRSTQINSLHGYCSPMKLRQRKFGAGE